MQKSAVYFMWQLGQSFFSGNNVLVGAFNDVIRNAVRGENNPAKGYVQGSSANASIITLGIEGVFSKDTVASSNINPNQVINYVACHDNYTLYDQLIQTMNPDRLNSAYSQAESIVFLAQGVPFIQEGEDFMRSKLNPDTGKYEGNSYNVGDYVNVMDYSLKAKNIKMFNKVKELIAFRKNNASLRLPDRQSVREKLKDLQSSNGVISYSIDDLLVIHTLNPTTVELDGVYRIVYSSCRDLYPEVTGSIKLLINESIVLKRIR